MNYDNDMYANVFLGFKNVKLLGINIGDIGAGNTWHLLKKYPWLASGTIIPETKFFEMEL